MSFLKDFFFTILEKVGCDTHCIRIVIQNLKFKVLQPFLVAERTLKHGPSGICGVLQGTANISAFYTETTILIQIGASDFFFPLSVFTLYFFYICLYPIWLNSL